MNLLNLSATCIRIFAFLLVVALQTGCALTEGLYSESRESAYVASVHFNETTSSYGLLNAYNYYEIDSANELFDALRWNSDRGKLNTQIRLAAGWMSREVTGEYRITASQDRLNEDEIKQLTRLGFSPHRSKYSDPPSMVMSMEGALQGQRLSRSTAERLPLVFQDSGHRTHISLTEAPIPKILSVPLTPVAWVVSASFIAITVPLFILVCTIDPYCIGG